MAALQTQYSYYNYIFNHFNRETREKLETITQKLQIEQTKKRVYEEKLSEIEENAKSILIILLYLNRKKI